MASSDSDDELPQFDSGEEDSQLVSSEPDDSEEEEEHPHRPAAKKRRVGGGAGGDSLGLELVAVHHADGPLAAAQAAASRIDASEEAEASLMQLEVEDLLREARPDLALEAALLDLVSSLAALLRALPEAEVASGGGGPAAAIKGFLADLAFQPVRPFVFRPPASVQVVGSFGLRAALRPSPCLDLALLMPAACFDSKDQLNHRYFAKRALYLAHVAAALKGHPQLSSVGWECLADDPRRPVLVLHPHQGLSPAGFRIRLLPAAPMELCPLPRLGPDRNSLRTAVAVAPPPARPALPPAAGGALVAEAAAAGKGTAKAGKGAKGGKGGKGSQQQQKQQQQKQQNQDAVASQPAPPAEPQLLPTPHYNTSVLQDILMLPLGEACRAAAASCPHFGNAASLLRVWARQQQLSCGADGLSGCMLTMLLVHLVESGQANPLMNAMHLFRTVLVAISNPKTFSTGLFMQRRQPGTSAANGSGSAAATPPDSKAWRRRFEVVFVDSSGWLNLAASLSKAALAQARATAARSLQLLNSGTPEAFDAVFLARQRQAALFDYWYHVEVPHAAAPEAADSAPGKEANGHAASGSGAGGGDLQQDLPAWRSVDQRVEALASKALGNRARLVRVFRRTLPASSTAKAPLRKGAPQPAQQHVLLGVQVDPTAALRTLDLGPSADKAEAARAYRTFWGDKAELRRFQDGRIAEAVVWEEGGPAERHLIPDRIVSYILQRHLPAGSSVACFAGALDAALRRKHSTPEADLAAAALCEAAAERLGKRLRSLASDSMPLRVVAVQSLAPVLRHAAAFPPLPHLLAGAPQDALATDHVARCLEPVELVCQLEGSGKWPDSPEAFQKMKAAMGCQLAQQLQQALGMEAQASEECVDVLTDGFAFRLLLATERDAAMQQKALQLSGEARVPPQEDMPLRTWHQGAISAVAGENPAFEPAVRLVKRWVGAHLLSPHLLEEAAELMLAHCFSSGSNGAAGSNGAGSGAGGAAGTGGAAVAAAPASCLSGLLRFLQLLAEHPWKVQPLIVDPNSELSATQRDAIVRQHAAQRAAGTAPALCIATPRDPTGGAWTGGRPSSQVLHRIVVLAQRSAAALEQLLLGSSGVGGAAGTGEAAARAAAVGTAFSRDLSEYDVLIQLRQDALPSAGNDLRLGKAATAAASSSSTAAARQQLGPALQAANEQLAAQVAAQTVIGKHSRAILKGIPQSILQARGHHAVRRELLVGFDPLPPFTEQLARRLGDLAVCCADYIGGSMVALKWRPAAFAPASLRPEQAHLACPAGSAEAAPAQELAARRQGSAAPNGKQQEGGGLSAAAVVPDVVGVLTDALQLGAGLVESIHLQ